MKSLTYVEIDIPSFNSPPTLATYRFAKDASYLPSNIDCIPNIKEVNITPAILSLGENLGQRASVTITFRDHKHIFLTEAYSSGTFWGKFRARYGLKLTGYDLRVIVGKLGDPLANMETRNFVIESVDGPSANGEYKIVAKDVLRLANGDTALAPIPSSGFLGSALTNVATSFTISPAGAGAQYSTGAWANIGGKEIVSFSRSGDVFTITRGQFNTTGVAHDAQERVQQCAVWLTANVANIIQELLVNFAGLNSSWVPLAAWLAETNAYLGTSYSANVAEPTAVSKLIDELIEQAGLVMWWDDVSEQIKLQVLRPVASDAALYDGSIYIANSLEVKEQPEKRLSQVYTYFAKVNPLINEEQVNNYKSTAYATNPTAEAAYGGVSLIKKIYSRWIVDGGRAIADTLNGLLLARFADPPRRISFDLLRDSVTKPALGVGYQIRGWPFQTVTGAEATILAQITRLNPRADVFEVEAEEISSTAFAGIGSSPDVHTVIIDSNSQNVNLRTMHDSIYGTPISGQTVNARISAGITVGSANTGLPALDIGTWPAGVTVNLTVLGRIQGAGGAGGISRSLGFAAGTGTGGSSGGLALLVGRAINLTDTTGQIWGGGGGGGGVSATSFFQQSCGGGGAGSVPGVHGGGDSQTVHSADGTTEAGGTNASVSSGFNGGAGGGPGLSGGAGTTFAGGANGLAISGIGFVTTVGGAGDRRGGTA